MRVLRLAPDHTRVELSDNPGQAWREYCDLRAQPMQNAARSGSRVPGPRRRGSIGLDPRSHPRHHRSEAPAPGASLETGRNWRRQGFTKQRRPICGIIGILVDKNSPRNRISANYTVIARDSRFCQRGGVRCLSLIRCDFPVHSL